MSIITRKFRNIISLFLIISIVIVLSINLIALWITPLFLLVSFSQLTLPIFIIFPVPILLFYIHSTDVMVWVVILIFGITISVLFLIARDLKKYVKTMNKDPLDPNSRLQRFAELFAISIFFSYFVYIIAGLVGAPVVVPISTSTPHWKYYLLLANAGLYEELISRVLLLGVPLFITYLVKNKITRKNWYRFFVGGKIEFNAASITFLLISSLFFGIAHIPSWDYTKFPAAFIAGLIMGYLFLRFGLYASVSFHFLTDYMSTINVMYPSFTAPYMNLLSVFIVFWFIAGCVLTVLYSLELLKIVNRGQAHKNVKTVVAHDDLWFHTIKCPYCGNESFEYEPDGSLKCLRCGTKIPKK
ncbi:MAG: CPBP family glutamic-type intramembrane protease [Thermoplasmata archaeon]